MKTVIIVTISICLYIFFQIVLAVFPIEKNWRGIVKGIFIMIASIIVTFGMNYRGYLQTKVDEGVDNFSLTDNYYLVYNSPKDKISFNEVHTLFLNVQQDINKSISSEDSYLKLGKALPKGVQLFNSLEVQIKRQVIEETKEDNNKNPDLRSDAIRAYQVFLEQSMIKWGDQSFASDDFFFIITDVNMDEIPELFLKVRNAPHYLGYEAIYYYSEQQIIEVTRDDDIISYYPESGIVYMHYYGMGDAAGFWQFSKNGNAQRIGYAMNFNDPMQVAFYVWNNEDVTKERFTELVKNAVGSQREEVTDSDWNLNTPENRLNMNNLVK